MPSGRHFLQIPGPSNVPDRVLRALARPTIDHRGPDFARMMGEIADGLRPVFGTAGPVVIFPSSGTGAWEAALVNTLKPGDRVLAFETGHFAVLWARMAERLGLAVDLVPGDWRRGVDPALLEAKLREDRAGTIRAVLVVHNETSTGATSRIPLLRQAIDRAGHGALFLVDTISSLGSIDYRHDEWGVDVTVCCSQKGLMLPPGLGFNALGKKAVAAAKEGGMRRSYWDWEEMLKNAEKGFFPYTPATNLLYGLRESLAMLREEGLPNVFARHARHAEATRRAVRAWGLEILCAVPEEHSNVLTAVMMPGGKGADAFRAAVLERFDMSLGTGLSKVADGIFRIGHLGDFNDLMLIGTLAGVEMGLSVAGVPHRAGGTQEAMAYLASNPLRAGPAAPKG
ncbi:MAG TPA: aminotransferase class V-fold PLP-dependent enzyme [Anaeromyxobacteraceae bacterium]|nr:aminotransferase class V-fold PLP-dependent enzyme [Anaeromyxobacteraceae bacterium]